MIQVYALPSDAQSLKFAKRPFPHRNYWPSSHLKMSQLTMASWSLMTFLKTIFTRLINIDIYILFLGSNILKKSFIRIILHFCQQNRIYLLCQNEKTGASVNGSNLYYFFNGRGCNFGGLTGRPHKSGRFLTWDFECRGENVYFFRKVSELL